MDRRNNSETTGRTSEEQFKKALGIIIQFHKGISPEELYREAVFCFNALIDLSYKNDASKDFAAGNGINLEYLIDGANIIISKMHFNSENDFYIALGLPQNASQDEIRERWKRLMLLYHPDRQIGNKDWFTDRAKKINEAYSTLKDDTKRLSYTKKLREQMLNTKSFQLSRFRTNHMHPNHSRKYTINHVLSTTRKYFSKIIVSLTIFLALIFIGFIYFQNQSSNLESELFFKKQQTSQKTELFTEEKQNLSELSNIQPEKNNISNAKEQKLALLNDTIIKKQVNQKINEPKEQPIKTPDIKKDEKQQQKTIRNSQESVSFKKECVASKETKTKQNTSILAQLSSNITSYFANKDKAKPITPVQSESEKKQTIPNTAQIPSEIKIEEQQKPPAINNNHKETKPVTSSTLNTIETTKEEVEDFIKRYIKAYESNDLETFMLFFSKSAVENNRLNYSAIRDAYKDTFREKINKYSLQNIDTRIDGLNVFISGTYNINRYLSAKNRWVRYRGKIYWQLAKENNSLKIISLNYDN